MLLKKVMRLYEDEWCCGFKTNASFDTNDCITDMDVTTDTEWTCSVANSLDNLYRIHLDAVE